MRSVGIVFDFLGNGLRAVTGLRGCRRGIIPQCPSGVHLCLLFSDRAAEGGCVVICER